MSTRSRSGLPLVIGQEDIPMLALTLTYHDSLYLCTELGVLGLVLLLYWLTMNHNHHRRSGEGSVPS
ncbi:MAG: hypothetical protein ACKO5P_00615 [Nodosilinea sp.]